MHFLTNFYKKNLNREFINKFIFQKTKQIPKIKNIALNFGCKTNDIKTLTSSLLALELITYQKSKFTVTKYPNILLKLRKGNPVGCKVSLRNQSMYYFLENITTTVLPKTKNFNGFKYSTKNKSAFAFNIKDNFVFKPIEEHYYLFTTLPKLYITITTTAKKQTELYFLIKSFQLPNE
jgi:large subunit ribosomal protein L5